MKIHNKLVRDKIPEIIKKNGDVPAIRTLKVREYKKALLDKLVEESKEARNAHNRVRLVNELADIDEVVMAIMKSYTISRKEISKIQREKRKKRGAFKKRIFLKQTN